MERFNTKWTREDKNQLTLFFKQGLEIQKIALKLGRTEKSIKSRLKRLGLIKESSVMGSPSSRFGSDGVLLDRFDENLPQDIVLINKVEYKENAQKSLYDLGRIDRSLIDAFYFVYFIVNKEHEVYIGCSQDVIYRVHQHNKNCGGKTTSERGPWYPFSILCVSSKAEALALESKSKSEFNSAISLLKMSLSEVLARIGIELITEKIKLIENGRKTT